jgi:hypothetical protein
MAADYIPTKDGEAVGWMRAFAAGIAADPLGYNVLPPDSAEITAAVEAFAAALAVSSNAKTRTKGAVATKNEQRRATERVVRRFAVLIKANADIPDTAKIAIGVRPVNHNRTRINVPTTSPALSVLAATNGMHHLHFADSEALGRRAKPTGATSLQLFVHVGDEPDADPSRASFYRAFTKRLFTVEFEHADSGKCATYFGRWASRRGEVGPWSLPVHMRVAA